MSPNTLSGTPSLLPLLPSAVRPSRRVSAPSETRIRGLGIALDTRWSDLEIAVVGETEGGCNRLPFVEKTRLTRDRHGDFLPARMYCTYSCENGLILPGAMARSGVAWPNLGKGRRRRPLIDDGRSEEHTSELQSLMRISYAVSCLKK